MGGTSVELVHLGSLYHDDVIDEAVDPAHGRERERSLGQPQGDPRRRLPARPKASEIAASLGTEVAGLLAATIGRLCEGEIRELQSAFHVDRTEDDYYTSVEGKTSALFATAARIGALVAGHDRRSSTRRRATACELGTAFQIVDDILDLTASEAELGKPTGHDLFEGVYTLPVLADPVARLGGERRAPRPARPTGRGHRAREGARHRPFERWHPRRRGRRSRADRRRRSRDLDGVPGHARRRGACGPAPSTSCLLCLADPDSPAWVPIPSWDGSGERGARRCPRRRVVGPRASLPRRRRPGHRQVALSPRS